MSRDWDARPGAPDYRIDDANFRDRFDTEPWMLTYKNRQRDGQFWDRASVRDRYDAIRIPTFHIGGWYDGYRDSVARMLEPYRSYLVHDVRFDDARAARLLALAGVPRPRLGREEVRRLIDLALQGAPAPAATAP